MLAIQRFQCDDCGTLHLEEDKARGCCPKQVSEYWFCSKCNKNYLEYNEAEECCSK